MFGCTGSYVSLGQITVTAGATAATLANKLTGPGVTIISPTLTCASIANGTFSGLSTLSFDSGIILTTGRANTIGTSYGSNGPASNFASTSDGTAGDAMLTALGGVTTYDACVLEFDFRPAGDTVKFNYVFGSEEYTDYACTSFNDVFGFFISGPGYSTATNIALVPGTTIPVCINSVNCGATGFGTIATCNAMGAGSPFCAYYYNNSTGTTITYDGLTTTLTAIAHVTPCDTYHLKIGIADGSDSYYDSGVFLEAGSLTSTGISVKPVGINSSDTTTGGQFCVRGCIPGKFIFNASAILADSLTIHFIITGSAVGGYDYSYFPDSVVIPAGSSSDTLLIHPLTVLPAGPKTIKLLILAPYTCGGFATVIDSAIITIYDSFYVNILTPDTSICLGQSVLINTLGDTSLRYVWTPSATLNNDTLRSPTATPSVTTTYTVSAVFPRAGCLPSSDQITVTIVQPFAFTAPPVQKTCVGVSTPVIFSVSPDLSTNIYSWTPGTYLSSTTVENPVATPGATGDFKYFVTVSQPAGCSSTDSILLHVLPNDFNLMSPDSGMCFNGIIQIRATGDSEFTYTWTPALTVSNPNIINPVITVATSTIYTITATFPGCPNMVHTIDLFVENPKAIIYTGDTMYCVGDSIHLRAGATPVDSPFTFSWSPVADLTNATSVDPVFYVPGTGDFPVTFTVQSPLGCTSSDVVTLSPRPNAQITVTPGNTTINLGDQLQLDAVNMTPYQLVYWWLPDNGTLSNDNINNPVVKPTDSVTTYWVYAMNTWGCRDSASVTIKVVDGTTDFIPTAFTPNGDGLNDIFRITNLRFRSLAEFRVYNRWGEMVYNNTGGDPKQGWDGTFNSVPQDMGVYFYQIVVNLTDGGQKSYKGEVTLVR